jgi:hypothetical protein
MGKIGVGIGSVGWELAREGWRDGDFGFTGDMDYAIIDSSFEVYLTHWRSNQHRMSNFMSGP